MGWMIVALLVPAPAFAEQLDMEEVKPPTVIDPCQAEKRHGRPTRLG